MGSRNGFLGIAGLPPYLKNTVIFVFIVEYLILTCNFINKL